MSADRRITFDLTEVPTWEMRLIKLGVNPYSYEGREYYEGKRVERVISKKRAMLCVPKVQKSMPCMRGDPLQRGVRREADRGNAVKTRRDS